MGDEKVGGRVRVVEEEEDENGGEAVMELSYDDDAWVDGGGNKSETDDWPEEGEEEDGDATTEKKVDPSQQQNMLTRMRVCITAVLDGVWTAGIYSEERLLARLPREVGEEERAAFRDETTKVTFLVADEADASPTPTDLVRLRSVTDNGTVLRIYLVEELYTWLSNSNKDPYTGQVFAAADLDDIWSRECARSHASKPRLEFNQKQDGKEYEAALNAHQFAELAEQDAKESKQPRQHPSARFAPYHSSPNRTTHQGGNASVFFGGSVAGGNRTPGRGRGGGDGGADSAGHYTHQSVEHHQYHHHYDVHLLGVHASEGGGYGSGGDEAIASLSEVIDSLGEATTSLNGGGGGGGGHSIIAVQNQQQKLWDRLRKLDANDRAMAIAVALSLEAIPPPLRPSTLSSTLTPTPTSGALHTPKKTRRATRKPRKTRVTTSSSIPSSSSVSSTPSSSSVSSTSSSSSVSSTSSSSSNQSLPVQVTRPPTGKLPTTVSKTAAPNPLMPPKLTSNDQRRSSRPDHTLVIALALSTKSPPPSLSTSSSSSSPSSR
jgi:hypothetical protein